MSDATTAGMIEDVLTAPFLAILDDTGFNPQPNIRDGTDQEEKFPKGMIALAKYHQRSGCHPEITFEARNNAWARFYDPSFLVGSIRDMHPRFVDFWSPDRLTNIKYYGCTLENGQAVQIPLEVSVRQCNLSSKDSNLPMHKDTDIIETIATYRSTGLQGVNMLITPRSLGIRNRWSGVMYVVADGVLRFNRMQPYPPRPQSLNGLAEEGIFVPETLERSGENFVGEVGIGKAAKKAYQISVVASIGSPAQYARQILSGLIKA